MPSPWLYSYVAESHIGFVANATLTGKKRSKITPNVNQEESAVNHSTAGGAASETRRKQYCSPVRREGTSLPPGTGQGWRSSPPENMRCGSTLRGQKTRRRRGRPRGQRAASARHPRRRGASSSSEHPAAASAMGLMRPIIQEGRFILQIFGDINAYVFRCLAVSSAAGALPRGGTEEILPSLPPLNIVATWDKCKTDAGSMIYH